MSLVIKSVLELRTFSMEKGLTIPLKQGEYDYLVGKGDLCIISKKEPVEPNSANWQFIGEDGYYSLGSDLNYISIQDRKSQTEDLVDVFELQDVMDNFFLFNDIGIFEIPAGNGGGLYAYKATNEKGHIIAIRLCDIEPEEINDTPFSLG